MTHEDPKSVSTVNIPFVIHKTVKQLFIVLAHLSTVALIEWFDNGISLFTH